MEYDWNRGNSMTLKEFESIPDEAKAKNFVYLREQDKNIKALELVPKEDRINCLEYLEPESLDLRVLALLPAVDRKFLYKELTTNHSLNKNNPPPDEVFVQMVKDTQPKDRANYFEFLPPQSMNLKTFKLVPSEDRWKCFPAFAEANTLDQILQAICYNMPDKYQKSCIEMIPDLAGKTVHQCSVMLAQLSLDSNDIRYKFMVLEAKDRDLHAFEYLSDTDKAACFKHLREDCKNLEALKLVPESDRIRCFQYLKADCKNLDAFNLIPKKDQTKCLIHLEGKAFEEASKIVNKASSNNHDMLNSTKQTSKDGPSTYNDHKVFKHLNSKRYNYNLQNHKETHQPNR